MDRRTLFFVFSLAFTLFFVNYYFDAQQQEKLIEWHKAEKIAKEKEYIELIELIKDKPLNRSSLSLEVFSTPSGILPGFLQNGSFITYSSKETSIDKNGKSYRQVFNEDHFAIYQINPEDQIQVADLPYFGKYDLVMVSFDEKGEATLWNALYHDGEFSLPLEKLEKLSKELKKDNPFTFTSPTNGIVLKAEDNSYLPVGFYDVDQKSFELLAHLPRLRQEIVTPQSFTKEEPSYYVLENAYQQLVFSSVGGAIAEINLPFHSDTHPESVVKEIDFDREIQKNVPLMARFPEQGFYRPGKNPEGPFEKIAKGAEGNYYPLLRRSHPSLPGRPALKLSPDYYAFNTVSEYPETAHIPFKVTYFDHTKIVFKATQNRRTIQKTYTLAEGNSGAPYTFDVEIFVDGKSKGLWVTSGIPEVELISGRSTPTLKYQQTRKGKNEIIAVSPPDEALTISTLSPNWVSNSNGFLGIIMDPTTEIGDGYRVQKVPGDVAPTRLSEINPKDNSYPADKYPGFLTMLPLANTSSYRVFAGPFATDILNQVDHFFGNPVTGKTPEYIETQSVGGWFSFISAPFAKFLFLLMRFFHFVTGSWGLSIILLTVALRLMLYPFNAKSTKSMLKMQQIAPEVNRIQEKYKNDPKRAQLEVMNLYRERGVNPASGCLPLLLQMPFLIGMYNLLQSTFELRGASFIPGWIDDLAAPDVLFQWKTPIFFIGNQFHLLPFLLGGAMFLQQRLSSTLPKNPAEWTEQQRQQRAMGTVMTVVFTGIFYHFPSGLNIYWLSSNLLGALQQWWTTKQSKNTPIIIDSPKKERKNRK